MAPSPGELKQGVDNQASAEATPSKSQIDLRNTVLRPKVIDQNGVFRLYFDADYSRGSSLIFSDFEPALKEAQQVTGGWEFTVRTIEGEKSYLITSEQKILLNSAIDAHNNEVAEPKEAVEGRHEVKLSLLGVEFSIRLGGSPSRAMVILDMPNGEQRQLGLEELTEAVADDQTGKKGENCEIVYRGRSKTALIRLRADQYWYIKCKLGELSTQSKNQTEIDANETPQSHSPSLFDRMRKVWSP